MSDDDGSCCGDAGDCREHCGSATVRPKECEGCKCCGELTDEDAIQLLQLLCTYAREYGEVDPYLTFADLVQDLVESLDREHAEKGGKLLVRIQRAYN